VIVNAIEQRYRSLPVHHTLEGYLDGYVQTAGIGEGKTGWLFRSAIGKTGQLSERALVRSNALDMIQRKRPRRPGWRAK
jgi:hypothetical protein